MAIVPAPTDLTRPFWEGARRGRLVTQHCQQCSRIWHPPLPRCPYCHSTDVGWRQVSGEGTIYSYTVVEHATHMALQDWVPYVIAMVELAEGPRMIANIRGASPAQIHVGMPVRVAFEEITPQVTLPQFVPAPANG